MKHGADWYQREPVAYLGGVQGLTAKEHAVYAVVLDLIYLHGGSVNNDPSWISGWISDMGSHATRKAIQSLVERGKLVIEGDQLTQKRAKTQAKTKENVRETRRESGKKGGVNSGKSRSAASKNNNLCEASASTREDKRREENTIPIGMDGDAVELVWGPCREWLVSKGVPDRQARSLIGKWLRTSGGAEGVLAACREAWSARTGDPVPYIERVLNPKPVHLFDLSKTGGE